MNIKVLFLVLFLPLLGHSSNKDTISVDTCLFDLSYGILSPFKAKLCYAKIDYVINQLQPDTIIKIKHKFAFAVHGKYKEVVLKYYDLGLTLSFDDAHHDMKLTSIRIDSSSNFKMRYTGFGIGTEQAVIDSYLRSDFNCGELYAPDSNSSRSSCLYFLPGGILGVYLSIDRQHRISDILIRFRCGF